MLKGVRPYERRVTGTYCATLCSPILPKTELLAFHMRHVRVLP